MRTIIYDIESDNLLLDATTIHCVGVKVNDEETQVFTSRPIRGSSGSITECIELLLTADRLVGHNIVKFDNSVIRKIRGIDLFTTIEHFDTLIASQLRYPNMILIDSNNKSLDSNLKGSHSLKAWGQRLGDAKDHHDDWSKLSEEMVEYCRQDVEVTSLLYKKLNNTIPDEAMRLEQKFAYIIARQEEKGVLFDVKKAQELHIELVRERDTYLVELFKVFTPLQEWIPMKEVSKINKDGSKSKTYLTQVSKGGCYNENMEWGRWETVEFNPSSGVHIVRWVEYLYGQQKWSLTDKGNPKTGAEEIERLFSTKEWAFPLLRYLIVDKLIGALASAKGAWLNKVREDGRIHGELDTVGAVSRRCTHCVPMSTKALTKDGWKGYDELVVGEYVLGYNLQTEKQEWTKVTDKHYFNNADVGLIGNKGNQLKCTADHKWVVMKRNRSELGYGNPRLVKASEIKHHDAILMNADYAGYSDMNLNIPERLPTSKYAGYNHMLEVLNYSQKELRAYLHGFLLADGYFKKSASGKLHSWSFAQAEGDILEASHLALYLFSNKRCSRTCKTPLKVDNQRFGYNITQTNKPYIRAKTGILEWRYTSTEDVWCPTTELGTWVMKQDDGIITITGNSNPNLAQVPSTHPKGNLSQPLKDLKASLGVRCRGLFIAPTGYKLVGCDADALELRTLSHYMARHDGGKYARIVDSGDKDKGTDIHTVNQKAAGLPTRDDAKTFIYALCYGAGAEKLGSIIGGTAKEGNKIKTKFFKAIPALKELTEGVGQAVKKNGYLLALDGNRYFIRSEHSALNTLLQGAGALVMKYYACMLYDKLIADYKWGEFAFVLNIHDEVQIEVADNIADDVKRICEETFKDVTDKLEFRIPLKGSASIGTSWAETH